MSEHNQIVSWTIDLQGEPYDLSLWALKFSRAEGRRYWVEREEITLPRYYSRTIGLCSTSSPR
jgi:hypothetical protein